jgi:hypothetical protein
VIVHSYVKLPEAIIAATLANFAELLDNADNQCWLTLTVSHEKLGSLWDHRSVPPPAHYDLRESKKHRINGGNGGMVL